MSDKTNLYIAVSLMGSAILFIIGLTIDEVYKQCRDRNRIDINIENSEHTADISDVESQTG